MRSPLAGAFFLLLVLMCPLLVLSMRHHRRRQLRHPGAAGVTAGGMNPAIVSGAYAEAVARSASPRVLLALFEAGLDESSFRDLANDNVPPSLAIAHDGVGNDHTSVGYLQQQVGADGHRGAVRLGHRHPGDEHRSTPPTRS